MRLQLSIESSIQRRQEPGMPSHRRRQHGNPAFSPHCFLIVPKAPNVLLRYEGLPRFSWISIVDASLNTTHPCAPAIGNGAPVPNSPSPPISTLSECGGDIGGQCRAAKALGADAGWCGRHTKPPERHGSESAAGTSPYIQGLGHCVTVALTPLSRMRCMGGWQRSDFWAD
jgi:hypothetical protein